MPLSKSGKCSLFAWLLSGCVVIVTAIALCTSFFGWSIYLELLSHFQLQYFVFCAIITGGLAVIRCRAPLLVSLFCTAFLSTQIFPWYFPAEGLLSGENGNLRILIANVNRRNTQYEAVIAFTQQTMPDLALFMEIDDAWAQQLEVLRSDFAYAYGKPNLYSSGILLLSHYPLMGFQLKTFSPDSSPSIIGQLNFHNQALALIGTHPLPPIRPKLFHSRNRQLNALGQYLQTVNTPKLVIGDFNLTMWSPYYRQLIQKTGLLNARDGFGLLPSWPIRDIEGRLPDWTLRFLSIPIDHCLISPKLKVTNIQVGPNVGSDHRPVVVDLRLQPVNRLVV